MKLYREGDCQYCKGVGGKGRDNMEQCPDCIGIGKVFFEVNDPKMLELALEELVGKPKKKSTPILNKKIPPGAKVATITFVQVKESPAVQSISTEIEGDITPMMTRTLIEMGLDKIVKNGHRGVIDRIISSIFQHV